STFEPVRPHLCCRWAGGTPYRRPGAACGRPEDRRDVTVASLLVLTGPTKGSRLPLEGERTVLGREAGCDVVICEALLGRTDSGAGSVSRRHAVISRVDGDYYIEDGDGRGNRSRNGVLVNDRKVPFPGRVRLRNNDCIRICDFGCTFLDD